MYITSRAKNNDQPSSVNFNLLQLPDYRYNTLHSWSGGPSVAYGPPAATIRVTWEIALLYCLRCGEKFEVYVYDPL